MRYNMPAGMTKEEAVATIKHDFCCIGCGGEIDVKVYEEDRELGYIEVAWRCHGLPSSFLWFHHARPKFGCPTREGDHD